MPTLHSLSVRRRGTTPVKSSAPPATTTHTIKGLFHRSKTLDSRKSIDKNEKTDKMGNAPSDMNPNANGTTPASPRPKPTSTASDRDSVRSRAMPGAEPPTPVPESVPARDERSPEPDTVQVQGYVTDEVPHILNPPSVEKDVSDERDLEAGIPPVSSFDVEDTSAQPAQLHEEPESIPVDQTDAARTPRAELKTEEGLAPLDIGSLPSHHAPEASDATAVAVSPSRVGTPPIWTPGTYVLLNARGGTAMDMSGVDNRSLIGYPMHGGPNQQWEFIPSGHGYLIRCVRRSREGHALYLTAEGGVKEHAKIVASPYPVAWNVQQTEDGIRISWPDSDLVFDLADWGNSKAGTGIQLAISKPGEACQNWHYTRCAPAADTEHEKEMGVEARSARAVSPPATTETFTISEERDFVTTTRTTTTTVITTVTETTRTPKSLFRQQGQAQRRSIAYR